MVPFSSSPSLSIWCMFYMQSDLFVLITFVGVQSIWTSSINDSADIAEGQTGDTIKALLHVIVTEHTFTLQ